MHALQGRGGHFYLLSLPDKVKAAIIPNMGPEIYAFFEYFTA
jgi:hypothetical protein